MRGKGDAQTRVDRSPGHVKPAQVDMRRGKMNPNFSEFVVRVYPRGQTAGTKAEQDARFLIRGARLRPPEVTSTCPTIAAAATTTERRPQPLQEQDSLQHYQSSTAAPSPSYACRIEGCCSAATQVGYRRGHTSPSRRGRCRRSERRASL